MIKRLISRLFDEKLEFRLRIFNMLALGGIIISYMMAIITVFQGGTAMMALMNAAAGTGALLLTALTNISGRCQLGYTLTAITVFLITFPVMFFIGGGYRSGMPCMTARGRNEAKSKNISYASFLPLRRLTL